MRRRELDKLEAIKLDIENKLAKALANERSVLEQLHESNLSYTEYLKKYEKLED